MSKSQRDPKNIEPLTEETPTALKRSSEEPSGTYEKDIFDSSVTLGRPSGIVSDAEKRKVEEERRKARAEVAAMFGGPEDLGDFEIIRESDFSSVEFIVSLDNPSTRVSLNDHKQIRVSEFQEKAIVFEIPSKKFAKGHSLILNLTCKGFPDSPPIELRATCKITECETMPDGTDQITLSLVQFNEKSWEDLKASFNRRQEEILKLFQSIKEG